MVNAMWRKVNRKRRSQGTGYYQYCEWLKALNSLQSRYQNEGYINIKIGELQRGAKLA